MPTAAKLVAAILFALVGFLVAQEVQIVTAQKALEPILMHEMMFGYFSGVVALIGLLCGWMVMGRMAGRGFGPAVGAGIQTAVTIVFFCLLVFAIREMILRSMRMLYHDAFGAILGMFGLAYDYGHVLLNPQVTGLLIIASVIAAWLTEAASKVWR